MQKSVIVKEKLMNIDMKNISTTFFKKQEHLKSSSQISSFSFAVMCNTKQIAACIKLAKQMIN